jgi:hypothetical protein
VFSQRGSGELSENLENPVPKPATFYISHVL